MFPALRWVLRLPPGASSFARAIDGLHLFVIATTFIGVAALTLISACFVVRYRARPGDSLTPHVSASFGRELAVIGFVLSLFLVWWVIGYRQYLELERRPVNALPVYVVAKQWMWKFSYVDGRIENDVLTVPVGRPVELIMTSRDVIHSFYVPAMRIKQDVLPGRYVSAWFEPIAPGSYPLFCAEFCGLLHSHMLGEVRVLSESDYRSYLEDAARAEPLAERGRVAALQHGCFSCHTVDGQPHIGPTWSRLYGSSVELADQQRVLADAAYLTESIMDPQARLVAGYRPVMPTYLGSLDASETAAIVEYIRSLQNAPIAPSVSLPKLDFQTSAQAGSPPSAESAP